MDIKEFARLVHDEGPRWARRSSIRRWIERVSRRTGWRIPADPDDAAEAAVWISAYLVARWRDAEPRWLARLMADAAAKSEYVSVLAFEISN